MGVEPPRLSPYHHVRKGAPPTLVLHGKEDATVSYAGIEKFVEAMTKAGNRCELEGYDGAGHGFFNYARKSADNRYAATLRRMDAFLKSLGYLEGEPTLQE
jgi:dipeptidyl aminopeptidase/acylaminoacyl peptidase